MTQELSSSLIVLFGSGGVGKNFCGDILEEDFEYHFYDTNVDFTDEMKKAVEQKTPFSFEMRGRWISYIEGKIPDLQRIHPRLAIANTFVHDVHRKGFRERLPDCEFVLVAIPEEERVRRIYKRAESGSGTPPEIAIASARSFEPISIDHRVLVNDADRQTMSLRIKQMLSEMRVL